MAYQPFPPVSGELDAERYVDSVVREGFEQPIRVPTLEDQRAIKTTCLEAIAQTSDFKTIMEYYIKTPYAAKILPQDFDISATHEWSEVIYMAYQAKSHYDSQANGVQGTVNRVFRFLGRSATAIEPWIALLPSGDYSSLVCGALKIGLSLASYRTDLCDKVFKSLDKLHDMQLKIEDTMKLYPEDFKMRELATRAYVCLLAMIQAMILKLVNEKTFTKILEAISRKEHRKQSNGNMTLQEKEDNFYNTIEGLDAHAAYLKEKSVRSTEKEVKKLGYNISMVRATSSKIYSGLMEQHVQISEGFITLQRAQGKTKDDILLEFQALEGKFQSKIDRLQANIQDEFSRLCVCHHQEHEYIGSLGNSYINTNAPQQLVHTSFVRKRLLRQLRVNDVRAAEELAATSKVPLLLEGPFHAHIQNLLRSQRLQMFFSTHENAILPLSCATEPYGAGLFSPLSIVAKAVIDAIHAQPQFSTYNYTPYPPSVYVLHFFAGFHTAPGDQFFGPAGLICSLLVQLLEAPGLLAGADVSNEVKRFHQHEINTANIGALCELFAGLVKKLPDGTVLFVVVDGLHLFTLNEDMEKNTRWVIETLEVCVKNMAWHATLKVVATFCGVEGLTSVEPLKLEGERGELDSGEGEDEDEEYFGGYEEPVRGMVDGSGGTLEFEDAVGNYKISDDFD